MIQKNYLLFTRETKKSKTLFSQIRRKGKQKFTYMQVFVDFFYIFLRFLCILSEKREKNERNVQKICICQKNVVLLQPDLFLYIHI